ncbi:hypothetical protein JTE90_002707 [Oedothorax gibbosus]|uniref:Uncharacterized protein n=1 Tax=Oedothorax gibbosus TaxID=931172 RepID=A0AAV6VWH7_9ARAC|nr:hypothetical protein JTE90_002707 [Oedothorax gibbosus]
MGQDSEILATRLPRTGQDSEILSTRLPRTDQVSEILVTTLPRMARYSLFCRGFDSHITYKSSIFPWAPRKL